MSESNPYQPSELSPASGIDIRTVHVRPIELLKRGYDFIGDQYWLFFGVTLVGMLIASAVPFGIIMGPMLVGIYLCFLARERGELVEFAKLFEGFDSFKESFIATLIIIAVSMILIIPLMILFFAGLMLVIPSPQDGGNNGSPPIGFFILVFGFYAAMLLVNFIVILPFLFTFQLIADRNVSAIDAVKLSFQGVRRNFMGLIGYLIVLTVVSIVLMMMCYLPLFFFMPISFASLFLVYRDIFPMQTSTPVGT
jgi:hypothetical protein